MNLVVNTGTRPGGIGMPSRIASADELKKPFLAILLGVDFLVVGELFFDVGVPEDFLGAKKLDFLAANNFLGARPELDFFDICSGFSGGGAEDATFLIAFVHSIFLGAQ